MMPRIRLFTNNYRRPFGQDHNSIRANRQKRVTFSLEQLEPRNMLAAFDLLAGAIDGEANSLRDTIAVANSNHEDDTITLAAGTYHLSLSGSDEEENRTGDIDLVERGNTITIIGAGADRTFISAELLADRVFDVHEGVTLILIGVTIEGGSSVTEGGGIRNSGTLELSDSIVLENVADIGGGIFNEGTLTLNSSTISHNHAIGGEGGGIFNAGELALIDSDISGNISVLVGADIWNAESKEPAASVIDLPLIDRGYFIDTAFTTTLIYSSSIGDIDGGFSFVGDALFGGSGFGSEFSYYLPVSGVDPSFQAGSLTAGSIDDHESLASFESFLADTLQNIGSNYPELNLGELVSIRVADATGSPIGDALVEVVAIDDDGNMIGDPLLVIRTGSDGRTLFSTGLDGRSATGRYSVTVTPLDGSIPKTQVFSIDNGTWDIVLVEAASALPTQLDIALVIDTTGSMIDELNFLKIEIESILTKIQEKYSDIDIRLSLVTYRDNGDAYVTRSFDFTDSLEDFRSLLEQQYARGGGDYPEAMHLALEDALDFSWREEDTARMLFLIADAPPHDEYADRTLEAVSSYREMGVRIFPVAASGVAQKAEYIMRSAAFMTLGEYLFLTDQSGYGNPHAEPDVPEYDVERLDQLMIRMISSELEGQKIPASEIIEHVETDGEGNAIAESFAGVLLSRLPVKSNVSSGFYDAESSSFPAVFSNLPAFQEVVYLDFLFASSIDEDDYDSYEQPEELAFKDLVDVVFGEPFSPLVGIAI